MSSFAAGLLALFVPYVFVAFFWEPISDVLEKIERTVVDTSRGIRRRVVRFCACFAEAWSRSKIGG